MVRPTLPRAVRRRSGPIDAADCIGAGPLAPASPRRHGREAVILTLLALAVGTLWLYAWTQMVDGRRFVPAGRQWATPLPDDPVTDPVRPPRPDGRDAIAIADPANQPMPEHGS